MRGFLFRRLVLAILVLATVSMMSFSLLKYSGGDLATTLAGEHASAEYIEFLRKEYGLDQPLVVQYGRWLARLARGDFGNSFYFGRPVMSLIADALPVTLILGFLALLLAVAVSIPLGIVAAIAEGRTLDRVVQMISLGGQGMPTFWFSYLLILLFGINLQWLPISGNSTPLHYLMPAVALSYFALPAFTRITRAGMIDVLTSDYIRTARAKGLPERHIIFRHALRNALVPVISVAAVQLGVMLGGSVVIETVFSLNGVGYLAWQAISQNDYPVVQAIVLIVSMFYVVLTLVADLVNAALDPRIRIT